MKRLKPALVSKRSLIVCELMRKLPTWFLTSVHKFMVSIVSLCRLETTAGCSFLFCFWIEDEISQLIVSVVFKAQKVKICFLFTKSFFKNWYFLTGFTEWWRTIKLSIQNHIEGIDDVLITLWGGWILRSRDNLISQIRLSGAKRCTRTLDQSASRG